jgi:hypothetical protein
MAKKIAGILIPNSLGPLRNDAPDCSRCHRTPLVGELLHLLESGTRVCSLCVTALPERAGEPVATERVRNGTRPLAVVRAA